MNRQEFGKLIAALRKEQFDFREGFWSQQTLADKLNVSSRYIGALEQGRIKNIEGEFLVELARVFNLGAMECQEFFQQSSLVENMHLIPPSQQSRKFLSSSVDLLREMHQPAYIHDGLLNLIAINSPLMALLRISDDDIKMALNCDKTNSLQFIFAPDSPIRTLTNYAWSSIAMRNVQYFRALSMRHRHTKRFQEIFQQLYLLPDFPTFWMASHEEHNDFSSYIDIDNYNHSLLGNIKYFITKTPIITHSDILYLVILTPADKSTMDKFHQLVYQEKIYIRSLVFYERSFDR